MTDHSAKAREIAENWVHPGKHQDKLAEELTAFVEAAVEQEREECAQVAERLDNTMMHQDKVAAAIRGRAK